MQIYYTNNARATLQTWASVGTVILSCKLGSATLFPTSFPFYITVENIVEGAIMKREIMRVNYRSNETFYVTRWAWFCPSSDTATSQTNTPQTFTTWDVISLYLVNENLQDIASELIALWAVSIWPATNILHGKTKLSVTPATAWVPISFPENDSRLPTQGENDAMVGTIGTPWTGNKYVTQNDTDFTNTMHITWNEAIGGIKTFSSIPTCSVAPTTANHAVNKSYMNSL